MNKEKRLIKIAIVEDDPYYKMAMQKYLHTICNPLSFPQFKFRIDAYGDAITCIETMDEDIDILILDYLLINKGRDEIFTAFDILKEVNISLDCTKLILVSAQQSAITTVRLMNAGVYEYIDKTVNSKNRVGAVVQEILMKQAS